MNNFQKTVKETTAKTIQQDLTLEKIPDKVIEQSESRIWRRSHSYNSLKGLRSSLKSFKQFMVENEISWKDCTSDPIKTLDLFASWLDNAGKMPKTTRTYLEFIKGVLRTGGAEFTNEEFKHTVILPKVRPFGDEKVDREQIKRIILATKHEALKILLMMVKDTQARPFEVLTLKVRDLNLTYEPPYFNIDAQHSKNDWPRELFFTNETKELILQRIQENNLEPNDFLLLPQKNVDEQDEKKFQKYVSSVRSWYSRELRKSLKRKLPDLNTEVDTKGRAKRYKIHLYSFKKFAFTVMADILGEMASRAIKGDKEYVMTYYRKSREERAEDYRKVMPKLQVFSEVKDVRREMEDEMRKMSDDDLECLLELKRSGKIQSSKLSLMQMN